MQGKYIHRVPHGFSTDAQVWWVDLDGYQGAVTLDGLGAPDYDRAARMVSDRDAQRFLAGQHALRKLLGSALDCPPERLVIEPDGFGKPRLAYEPRLHFNLSHSGGQGLIGVSSTQAIGVDIELVHGVADAEALVGMHFTDEEREEWARAAGPLRDRAFLACWTRKEACAKALGLGLLIEPASLNVGCSSRACRVCTLIGSRRHEVTVCSLRLSGDAIAAVALAAPATATSARLSFRSANLSE